MRRNARSRPSLHRRPEDFHEALRRAPAFSLLREPPRCGQERHRWRRVLRPEDRGLHPPRPLRPVRFPGACGTAGRSVDRQQARFLRRASRRADCANPPRSTPRRQFRACPRLLRTPSTREAPTETPARQSRTGERMRRLQGVRAGSRKPSGQRCRSGRLSGRSRHRRRCGPARRSCSAHARTSP